MPFWGVHFTEKEKTVIHINERMAPGTQLAVLFLYYKNIDKNKSHRIVQTAQYFQGYKHKNSR